MAAARDEGGGGSGAGSGAGSGSSEREPEPAPEGEEGGGEGDGEDGASSERILRTGALLLEGLLRHQAGLFGDPHVAALVPAELGPPPPCGADAKRLGECLRRVGDRLERDTEFQSLLRAAAAAPLSRGLLLAVAGHLFSDGRVSWGRIVALFYAAVRLLLHALQAQGPPLLRRVLDWTLGFFRQRLLGWVRGQGGWAGLASHVGSGSWSPVLLVGVVTTASFALWKMS